MALTDSQKLEISVAKELATALLNSEKGARYSSDDLAKQAVVMANIIMKSVCKDG